VTRLRAELVPPGIALTAASPLIDSISAMFTGLRAVEPLLVERSRHISGSW